MNAVWNRFFLAVALATIGQTLAIAADVVLPTAPRPIRGVAEYSEEFAGGEEKPLIEWLHPFTRHIARGSFGKGVRMRDAFTEPRPKVYLEDEDEIKAREFDFMKLAETGAASGRIVVPAHGPAPVELDFLAPPVFDSNDRRFDDPTQRAPQPSTEPPMRNWTIAMR